MNYYALLIVGLTLFMSIGTAQSPDGGEEEILPEEIMRPSAEWDDNPPWGGHAPKTWYEDESSLDGIFKNETKSQSSTSTSENQR